jgi:hypothetical protein
MLPSACGSTILRYRLDAGTHDLDRIGGQVDGHGQRGCLDGAEVQPHAGQAEKDEEHLHEKRGVADQFNVAGDDLLRRFDPAAPEGGTADTQADADHRGKRSQPHRHQCSAEQQRVRLQQRSKVELMLHCRIRVRSSRAAGS